MDFSQKLICEKKRWATAPSAYFAKILCEHQAASVCTLVTKLRDILSFACSQKTVYAGLPCKQRPNHSALLLSLWNSRQKKRNAYKVCYFSGQFLQDSSLRIRLTQSSTLRIPVPHYFLPWSCCASWKPEVDALCYTSFNSYMFDGARPRSRLAKC